MKASFWLDIFYLLLLVSLPLCAAKKGLIRALFAKLRFILPFIIAFLYTPVLEKRSLFHFHSRFLQKVSAFFVVFLCALIFLILLESLLAFIFENNLFAPINFVFGFIFGLLEALVIALFVTEILVRQKFFDFSFMTDKSFFFQKFSGFLGEFRQVLPHIKKDV